MKYPIVYQEGGNMSYKLFNEKFRDLIYYKSSFNKEYPEGWIFTGSSALMVYAYAFLTEEEFKRIPVPNDVDVLIHFDHDRTRRFRPTVPNKTLTIDFPDQRSVFKRTQDQGYSGVTFRNEQGLEIDARMEVTNRMKTTLYDLPIITAQKLFENL